MTAYFASDERVADWEFELSYEFDALPCAPATKWLAEQGTNNAQALWDRCDHPSWLTWVIYTAEMLDPTCSGYADTIATSVHDATLVYMNETGSTAVATFSSWWHPIVAASTDDGILRIDRLVYEVLKYMLGDARAYSVYYFGPQPSKGPDDITADVLRVLLSAVRSAYPTPPAAFVRACERMPAVEVTS